MSEVQNTVPLSPGRGIDVGFEEGRGAVLDAGKEGVLNSVVKPVARGPKGGRGVRVEDNEMREAPVRVLLDAITRRVGGRFTFLTLMILNLDSSKMSKGKSSE